MITSLPFDSDLFGYAVGKVTVDKNWDEGEFLKAAEPFELVYLFSGKKLVLSDKRIKLVDEKVVFERQLSKDSPENEIGIYIDSTVSKDLLHLALRSGQHSRFRLDDRLSGNEFQKLYALWIKKAVDEGNVLCDPQMKAMVTFSLEGQRARIGLLAVNEEHQSKGLGTHLVHAAEREANKAGAKSLSIPTQRGNKRACSLYEKMGYKVAEVNFVYHWKRKVEQG